MSLQSKSEPVDLDPQVLASIGHCHPAWPCDQPGFAKDDQRGFQKSYFFEKAIDAKKYKPIIIPPGDARVRWPLSHTSDLDVFNESHKEHKISCDLSTYK